MNSWVRAQFKIFWSGFGCIILISIGVQHFIVWTRCELEGLTRKGVENYKNDLRTEDLTK